ncbi:hypothetical protein, partial [Burkholderia sp. SIMBA_024]|uniref:hypothetical protein n=1 Tax=Burkholderia sp. SIMBA_024 TaxID=3085768 RepID=UPI00397B9E41
LFGKPQELLNHHIREILFEFSMILIVLVIGFFYVFLAGKEYRKKNSFALPLAINCIFFGLMNSIYSERIITILFPDITLR